MTNQITAAELLAQQREVERLQEVAAEAWTAVSRAQNAVEVATLAHESARWEAEEAHRDLSALEKSIGAGT